MKPTILLFAYLCLFLPLQAQVSKTVDITTAGSLKTMLTQEELKTITNLTLTGIIDVRDFYTMRDSMPVLENVDMEEVTIEAHEESGVYYNKNEVPDGAFINNVYDHIPTLKSIVLPSSTVIVRHWAFSGCSSLTTINIPASVNTIFHCAFSGCTGLMSIYCYASAPAAMPDPNTDAGIYWGGFDSVDKEVCVLYVPSGCKEIYASDYYWSVFKNIVEMTTGVDDLQQNIAQFNCYPNPFVQQVTIEIRNPKRIKLSVDIYNMTGKKIKTLAIGNTSELLNLMWDGTNEIGQKVLPGIYICKMNEQARKLFYMGKNWN